MTLSNLPLKLLKNSRGNIYVDSDIGFEKSKNEELRCRVKGAIRIGAVMKKKIIRTFATTLGETVSIIFLFLFLYFRKN